MLMFRCIRFLIFQVLVQCFYWQTVPVIYVTFPPPPGPIPSRSQQLSVFAAAYGAWDSTQCCHGVLPPTGQGHTPDPARVWPLSARLRQQATPPGGRAGLPGWTAADHCKLVLCMCVLLIGVNFSQHSFPFNYYNFSVIFLVNKFLDFPTFNYLSPLSLYSWLITFHCTAG